MVNGVDAEVVGDEWSLSDGFDGVVVRASECGKVYICRWADVSTRPGNVDVT